MALKTDYKDYIASGNKKFAITDNGDGTSTIEDKTSYSQTGDSFGAEDINAVAKQVNLNEQAIATQGEEIEELNKLIDGHIYGFKREIANSNYSTRITYTDDATGKTPVTVNKSAGTFDYGSWQGFIEKIARPVMLKKNGTVDYELNHDDTSKKLDGSDSDISNVDYDGNAMVEFRNYRWVSRKTVDGYDYVRFANYKVDDTFEDNAFIDESGKQKLAFYFSMFEGSLDTSNVLRSLADTEIMVSKNAATEMSYSKANGDGWNTGAWCQLNYIWDLLTLLGKTDGLQETFGNGVVSASDKVNTGGSKAKGCFYAPNNSSASVRTLWIEDLWGNVWDRYAGLINDNGTFKVKLTGPYPTPTDNASTYADYIDTGLVTPAEGYVKEANCSEWGFLPQATGGSASTYFCDYFYKNDSGVKYVIVGGHWNDGSLCGRYVYLNYAASITNTDIGARLQKL